MIEMQKQSNPESPPALNQDASEPSATVPPPQLTATSPLLYYEADQRACFICLEDDEVDLVSCCSLCYGMSHRKCWREWRASQRSAASRARNQGVSSRDPFTCSICKSGRARIQGETVTREWIETVLSGVMNIGRRSREGAGRVDSEQLDMFMDPSDEDFGGCCTVKRLLVNFILIVSVISLSIWAVAEELVTSMSGWFFAVIIVIQLIVVQIGLAFPKFRRQWRERHRPVAALVNEEIHSRTGRLFPVELNVEP